MGGDTPKLLIVDDEHNTREAMARYLGRRFRVTTAADGGAALEELAKEKFDLVLTDLRMPHCSGMDVLEAVRKQQNPPSCILLTAYAALSFGRKPEEEKELKITIPENLDYTGLFDDLFGEYTRSAELISVRTTGMGSLYNLHYHVRLVSPEIEKQFLDAIRCRNGNLDIVCGKVPQVKEAL